MTQVYTLGIDLREMKTGPKPSTQMFIARDIPGGPVVRAPHFHCRGCGFDPCLGN